MHLATYTRAALPTRGAMVYAETYPSKAAQAAARAFVVHPMSDEAIAHFERQPAPAMDARLGRLWCMARSFTPFDKRKFD